MSRDLIHRLGALVREHAPVVAVLVCAAALRVLTQIAYGPALYYYDSLAYLAQANGRLFSNPGQPAGYPLMIRLLRLGGSSLGGLTVAQHLAGLLTGLLVYLVVLRLSGRKSFATVAVAIVVLDGYVVAVEQYVMTEAFFALFVVLSATLALLSRRRSAVVASGGFLAIACMLRPVGLFCVPVWLAYVVWQYRWSFTLVLSALALLFPLIGYAAANDFKAGHFALTDDTAWLFYARIASIGGCSGLAVPSDQRILCPSAGQIGKSASFYLYAADSPAVRAFGQPSVRAPARVDRLLLGYSLGVMSQRPLRYLGLVGRDFLKFFVPQARSDYPTEDGPITLPKPGSWLWPTYRPRQRWPAGALRAYASVVHTIRPLLGILLLTGILAFMLKPAPGGYARRGRRPALGLLLGMALGLLLGAVASHFELRYALPAVPLAACAGMLGLASLWEHSRSTRQRLRLGLEDRVVSLPAAGADAIESAPPVSRSVRPTLPHSGRGPTAATQLAGWAPAAGDLAVVVSGAVGLRRATLGVTVSGWTWGAWSRARPLWRSSRGTALPLLAARRPRMSG